MKHPILSGWVEASFTDKETQSLSIQFAVPNCLMNAVMPVLIQNGVLDQQQLLLPLRAWVPVLNQERFKPETRGLMEVVNQASIEMINKILTAVTQAMSLLADPSDVMPVLPLGVYVTFRYRCKAKSMMPILESLESIPVIGVPEFKFAMAGVLAEFLRESGDVLE